MNKKGFTLIELLAIIAIIGIIGIITVPAILNVIDNSKKNTAYDSVYGYTRAIKEYYYTMHLHKDEVDDFVGKRYKINQDGFLALKSDESFIHQISFTGVKPDSGLIDIGPNGEISGCIVVNDFRFYIEDGDVTDDILKGDNCLGTYTITFDTRGGNSIDSITAKEGSTITLPTPIKTIDNVDFTFDGWYDSDGEAVSDTMPSDNVTYYAHYENITAKFATGFVNKVKTLADNDTANIYKFLRADSIDSTYKNDTYKVSNNDDSDVPIYMWYDSTNHIVYWYSLSEHPGFKDTSLYQLFYNATNLTDISGLADFDVSNVTNMSEMFNKAASLSNIGALANWAQWTSTKKLTTLSYMFRETAITNVNALSNWDISNVTNLSFMFYQALSLDDISGLANWAQWTSTKKLATLSYMFRETAITNVDALSNWDISNVANLSYMFYGTTGLNNISGLSNWAISNVTNLSYMFYGTTIENVNALANWAQFTSTKKLANLSYMFQNAASLNNISGLANWDISNVTNLSSMFRGTAIENVNALANWAQWTSTKQIANMANMFQNAASLNDISGLANWDISNVTSLSYMFFGTSIENVNALSNWAQWTSTKQLLNLSNMFQNAASLNDVSGLANWDISNVTNLSSMFNGAASLTDATSLHWVTRSVGSGKYSNVFYQTGVKTSGNYPTFYSDDAKTQVISGTWNSVGTFTPS